MEETQEYDEHLKDIRLKIAMEKSEWYTYFQLRDKFINWMIFSFFGVYAIIAVLLILLNFGFLYIAFVPNLTWLIFFAPFFSLKIYFLSKKINEKKEEIVLQTWNVTHDIDEIGFITGLEEIFIRYYLKKNGLYEHKD